MCTDFGYDELSNTQNSFPDFSNTFNPNFMFNSSEFTNEYNLLNDFLNSSLLEDPLYLAEAHQASRSNSDQSNQSNMAVPNNFSSSFFATSPTPTQDSLQIPPIPPGTATPRLSNPGSSEKAKETYFMEAADPAGAAPPEERMNHLLDAKYKAGLLKPFNYVGGYARLNEWMSKNLHPAAKRLITEQLNRFRPAFRERIKPLKDIQLIQVEMWFERELMKYDRVFASMAIPACCWRRTGEIYRGNTEMSELLGVESVENLRDVSIDFFQIYSGHGS